MTYRYEHPETTHVTQLVADLSVSLVPKGYVVTDSYFLPAGATTVLKNEYGEVYDITIVQRRNA